jgi:hypothetical protein
MAAWQQHSSGASHESAHLSVTEVQGHDLHPPRVPTDARLVRGAYVVTAWVHCWYLCRLCVKGAQGSRARVPAVLTPVTVTSSKAGK